MRTHFTCHHRGFPSPFVLTSLMYALVSWSSLLFGSLILPPIASRWTTEIPLLAGLPQLQASIQQAIGTTHVGVSRGTSTFKSTSGSGSTKFLKVRARLPHRVDDFEAPAREIASIVLKVDDRLGTYDRVIVVVSYGFDILIAQTNVSKTFSKSPSEWRIDLSAPD